MTTATLHGLTVSVIADLLVDRGFRVTVQLPEAIVAERPDPTIPQTLRRVVAQLNHDDAGSWRCAYLFARPGQLGGPVYKNELMALEPVCRDLAQFAVWLAMQDARHAYRLDPRL